MLPSQDDFISKESPLDGSGFWSQYKGNSIGRAINHIYHICGLRYAENAVFHGNGVITQGQNKPFATMSWERGYPYFKFEDEHLNKRQDELLNVDEDVIITCPDCKGNCVVSDQDADVLCPRCQGLGEIIKEG